MSAFVSRWRGTPGRSGRIVAKAAANVLVLGMLTGRHPDKSAKTLIHAGVLEQVDC
jgi:hypothetical protein